MANPQIENGHIDIANEIMEALAKIRLSGQEWQILCVILRKTYGWHKKQDAISLSQFHLATGIKSPNVIRAIKKLLSKQIINVIKTDNTLYSINKDYEQWKPLSKQITIIKTDNLALSKQIHTKEKDTKERKKINKRKFGEYFNIFWKVYPKKRNKGDAEKAFKMVAPDEQLMEAILTAIEQATKSAQWLKDNGQFIPYPATWLRAKGWEDEEDKSTGEEYIRPEHRPVELHC